MGRGSATEDELAAGIRKVGVLSAVAGPDGTRRDNPFAAPIRPKTPPPEAVAALPSPDRPRVRPSRPPEVEERAKEPPRPSRETEGSEPDPTEPVTVRMTAESRTRANLLAAELQRRRTARRERFTPNSVFRVAIEAFLDHFELASDDRVNSEDELRALVAERIGARKRTKG